LPIKIGLIVSIGIMPIFAFLPQTPGQSQFLDKDKLSLYKV
jgi:hypothetical protein